MINPVQDITPDGLPMEGTTNPEHPALGVSLHSGLMEGIMRSVTRPDGGSIREFAKWNVMAHPVPDINPDGRPMEGIPTWSHRLWRCLWTVNSWSDCCVRNRWSSQCSERCRLYDRMRQIGQSVRLWHPRCTTNSNVFNHRHGRCWIRIYLIIQMSTTT